MYKCDAFKAMGLQGLHPKLPRELASGCVMPPSSIFERLWKLGEVPSNWRKDHITSVLRQEKNDD